MIVPGGFFRLAAGTGSSTMTLQDAQGHFSHLVAYVLCLGMPVGVGLGIRGAICTVTADQKFAWGRAVVAGGFAGTLGGLIFGRWVSSGDYFPLLAGFGGISLRSMSHVLPFSLAPL